MCGIAGWIDWELDLTMQSATLEAMTGSLGCCRADERGMWLSSRAALGCRQLYSNGVAGGRQPILNGRVGRGVVLLYTGALRDANRSPRAPRGGRRSFAAPSSAKAAALLRACDERSAGGAQRLDGTYSFAMWEKGESRLVMGRDWGGVTPLFYTRKDEGFIFSSQLKALLAHPAVGSGAAGEEGDVAGVCELPPGQLLVYDRKGLRTLSY